MRPLIFLVLLFAIPIGLLVALDIDPRHWPRTSSQLAGLPLIGERFQSPDRSAMHAYVVSKLSDAQLLDLRQRSIELFETRRKQAADDGRRFWAERERRAAACEANPASKLRSETGCREPLPIGFESIGRPELGSETPEKIFETELLGHCVMANSVDEARRMGCLPPATRPQ
jgi:hypothetical protein